MSSLGEPIEEFAIGAVRVLVRHGCVRRDQYELLTAQPLPAELSERLAALGKRRGTPILYTVDVEGVHQLTVAPARGRLVIMPRLTVDRAAQRASAVAVAELIAAMLPAAQT